MGMRKSTRQELRKLREIVREVFEDRLCCFCKEPMISEANAYNHGDGESSPFDVDWALHHRDGNHSNNEKRNRVWSHRRCHKAHHMTERHKANRKAKKMKKETR